MALTLVKGNIIEDGAVTSGQLAATSVTSATILDNTIANVKMAVNPADASNLNAGTVADARMPTGYVESLDPIMNDVAVVGFKIAANGSLAKYNLVDQTVDAFEDATGIDSPASSDQVFNSGSKYFAATVVAGATDVFTTVASTTWTAPAGLTSVTYLVIAGGGGGGASQAWDYGGGGGGAGGLRTGSHSVTGGNNYTVVVGGGGTGSTTQSVRGNQGSTSTFDSIDSAGGGGGGAGAGDQSPPGAGTTGGSGAGGSGGWAGTTLGNVPSTTPAQGFPGSGGGPQPGSPIAPYAAGGGGGSSQAGHAAGERRPSNYGGGAGGNGTDLSATFGTSYGVSGVFAGGGGGGWSTYNTPNPMSAGPGGSGGGGASSNAGPGTQVGVAGTVNTGSGGGGGATANTPGHGGAGGSGIVLVKYDSVYAGTMSLISTATTAQTAPTKGDLVMLWSDGTGTASINTDITAEYSADNGSTYTTMTLVAQGTTGGQNLVAANDVTLTSTSGTTMRYRVKALNQSISRSTRIHAVSLGWS